MQLVGWLTDYKKETDRRFNVIDGVYENDEMVVVYEYYLSFEFNHNNCVKYYNEEVCDETYEGEYPLINDDVIKESGVYYRHEFIKEDDEYYLKQSFIYNS